MLERIKTGPRYRYILRAYYLSRWQLSRWRQVADPIRQWKNGNIYALDLGTEAGFFGILTNLVYVLAHCEAIGRKPYVRLTGSTYRWPDDNPNWFDNYFRWKEPLSVAEQAALARGRLSFTAIRDARELGLVSRYGIGIRTAHRLFHRYVEIREELLDEVDQYCSTTFSDKAVLGLHYRGTDKWIEAPRVDYADVREQTERLIGRLPRVDLLYVATDEDDFLAFMKRQDLGVPMVWSEAHEVTRGDRALHFLSEGDKYRRGREALVTSLVLSRCQYCIKTPSFLSAWAKVFRPELPVMLLTAPYARRGMFGDWEIQQTQQVTL